MVDLFWSEFDCQLHLNNRIWKRFLKYFCQCWLPFHLTRWALLRPRLHFPHTWSHFMLLCPKTPSVWWWESQLWCCEADLQRGPETCWPIPGLGLGESSPFWPLEETRVLAHSWLQPHERPWAMWQCWWLWGSVSSTFVDSTDSNTKNQNNLLYWACRHFPCHYFLNKTLQQLLLQQYMVRGIQAV